jgi:hypothetical protein
MAWSSGWLAARIAKGLRVVGIPTSETDGELARSGLWVVRASIPTPRTNGAQCYVGPFHREVAEPQERHTQEGERQIERDIPAQGHVRRGQRQDAVKAFPVFRSVRGGFRTPVSERHFPISISAGWRPVRMLTETGSQTALRRARQHAPSPKPHMIQMKAAPRRQDLRNTCNERQG